MDAYKAIIGKRDVRSFTEQPVPEEAVHRLLQAGRMAGSSKNSQPCVFIAIDDPAVKTEIAKCGDFAAWAPNAPLLIAIAVRLDAPRGEYDAGRASQNMMVAGWAEDLGSCPLSMHHVECARDALGLPESMRVAVVVGFGYRSREHRGTPESARKPWDEYVRRNRY